MGVIANVQGIVIVNRSLDWTSYTDCSVTSVGHACLFTMYSYMLVLISVTVISRVHNIIGEESVLLCNSLYKRVLQSISAFHRLLP